MKAKRDTQEELEEDDVSSGDDSGANSKKKIKRFLQIAGIIIGGIMMFITIFGGDKTQQTTQSSDQSTTVTTGQDQSAIPAPTAPLGSEDIDLTGGNKSQVAPAPIKQDNVAFEAKPLVQNTQVPEVQAPVLPDLPEFKFDKPKDDQKKQEIPQPKLPDLSTPQDVKKDTAISAPNLPDLKSNLENPDSAVEKKRDFKMFVIGGDAGGSDSSQSSKKTNTKSNDFIIYDKSKLVEQANDGSSKNTQVTQVTNLENQILQGKMLDVVLETAINSQLPGTTRGIVSRDVFGESGSKILIPKGTRVYGTYSSTVTRGQSRLNITWNRVIRPDGVSISMTAQASDQFGRAGIEADVDNRYGEIFGNSLLLSFVNLGAAVALEKLTGSTSGTTQTVNSNGSVTTTNINPINLAAQSVIQNTSDIASKLTSTSSSISPIVTLPQGTKIKVIVNQDITVPDYTKERL